MRTKLKEQDVLHSILIDIQNLRYGPIHISQSIIDGLLEEGEYITKIQYTETFLIVNSILYLEFETYKINC